MHKLPQSWIRTSIESVAEVNPKKNVDLDDLDLVSFVPMAAVDEDSGTIVRETRRPYYEVAKGFTQFIDDDVIFAKITPSMENGKSAVARNLANGVGLGSTEFHVFRSRGAIYPDYLWRFVRQQHFRRSAKDEMSGAVGQQRVPAAYLKSYNIPLPPFSEQERIAERLDETSASTSNAQAQLSKIPPLLELLKKQVLEMQFVKFDKGIKCRKLVEITTKIGSGSTPRGGSRVYVKSGVPFIRSQNVYFERFAKAGLAFIDDEAARALKNVTVERNDVLLNISGASIGRATIVPDELVGARVNQHVSIIRCKPLIEPKYLFLFLWTPQIQEWIDNENYGSTRQALTKIMIENIKVPLPPLEIQRKIIARIETTFAWIDEILSKHNSAARLIPQLNEAIFAKAFQGQLVEQNPEDEPAVTLLEKLASKQLLESKKRKSGVRLKRGKAAIMTRPKKIRTIKETLENAGSQLSGQDLLEKAGYPRDVSSEQIESFFLDLRKALEENSINRTRVDDQDYFTLVDQD